MVTPQEIATRLAKAREPIKPVEAPVEEVVEEEVEEVVEEETPVEDDGEKTSDGDGSVIDEDETED